MVIEGYKGIWYKEQDGNLFRCSKSNKIKKIKHINAELKYFYGLRSIMPHPLYGGPRRFFLEKEITDRIGTKLPDSLAYIIEKTTNYELRDDNLEYTVIRNQWLKLAEGDIGKGLEIIMKSGMKYDEIKNHTEEVPDYLIALGILGVCELINMISDIF